MYPEPREVNMRFEVSYPAKRPVVKVYIDDRKNTTICFYGNSASPSINQRVREVHAHMDGQSKAGYNILGSLYPNESLIHCFERALTPESFAKFWQEALDYMNSLRGSTVAVAGSATVLRLADVKKFVLGTEKSLRKFKQAL